ncbi:hypothetical protein [Herbaspirillum sp. YR522]|uniref:hypothetical protein n=1 Tax=Herbaspirillum sp. YR522 TaxID=1144342 RepID=UPI00026F538E|nr:hypothetical protein [Herbaspirillum sp. YR522]EJN07423.1 hypothetical protein PMI40_01900 [Herbaspirillum sp. YR522]
MRRLLLLLLTFLLPLQLLAATVGDLSAPRIVESASQACPPSATTGHAAQQVAMVAGTAFDAWHADTPSSPQPGDDDDADAPAVQADCEDHTLPGHLATPGMCWHPFPHAFVHPLHWSSFDRDQLRPPPLA